MASLLVKYEWRDVLCKKGLLKCWYQEGNRLWDEYDYAPFPPDTARNNGAGERGHAGLLSAEAQSMTRGGSAEEKNFEERTFLRI
jgi:hypothetical protein